MNFVEKSYLSMLNKPGTYSRIIIILTLSVLIFSLQLELKAQVRRALLVGINNYSPAKIIKKSSCRKEWNNLRGCINDVEAIKGILVSKFYFKNTNIHVLIDEQATRGKILSSIETHLIKESAPGDVCVFYFAGHGSQVMNSKSFEYDQKDETIVPADWYLGKRDIRDKELNKLFNRIIDKAVRLIVIVDACHSGSISRGIPSPLIYRCLPANDCYVSNSHELPGNEKDPSARGAIIFSAARSFQFAIEKQMENGKVFGLFSWALVKVLRNAPQDESIKNIFLSVRGLIKSEGFRLIHKISMPDAEVEILPHLLNQPLFSEISNQERGDDFLVSVAEVNGTKVTLLGGYAAGIRKECELKPIFVSESKFSQSPGQTVRLRVNRLYGPSLCRAEVIQGDAKKIHPGDLFAVDRWVIDKETKMRVCIAVSNFTHAKLLEIANEILPLMVSRNIEWVDDPSIVSPTHIMYWEHNSWWLEITNKKLIRLGRHPKPKNILEKVLAPPRKPDEKPRFFLHLPLSSDTNKQLEPEVDYYSGSVEVLPTKKDSQYILVGRFAGEKIEYSWLLPNRMVNPGNSFALPVRTKWIAEVGANSNNRILSNTLFDQLLRLVKIRAWLQLASPRNQSFPYYLALKNAETGEIKTQGHLTEGEIYGLILKLKTKKLAKNFNGRYIYVFSIDSSGKGSLLFPLQHRRNSDNFLPASNEFPMEIQLGDKRLFRIKKPFGEDTFFLLTSAEAIAHPGIFNFSGVRKKSPATGDYSSLERVLYYLGAGYRDLPPLTYAYWSLERLFLKSKPVEPNNEN